MTSYHWKTPPRTGIQPTGVPREPRDYYDNGEGGFFDIRLDGFEQAEQSYVRNTPVLTTTLHAADGSGVEITDFAPRFKQFDRV